MAVLKNKREGSPTQFIEIARALKSYTRTQCLRLPKRLTFFGVQETFQSASRVFEHIKKANGIFPPATKEEVQMRRQHFLEAQVELQYLEECIADIRDISPIKDAVMIKWLGMVDEEKRLIKGMLTKDKERFSKIML